MDRRWITITDLGFGDAGKGTITDYLCSELYGRGTITVVRHNGGPQAAHNVVVGDRHHTFSQFGSGTFVPGVRTFLGPDMLINPHNLLNEYNHLYVLGEKDALDRLYIHRGSMVIMPWHVWTNQLLELSRGDNRHGSCGQGIGVLREQSYDDQGSILLAGSMGNPDRVTHAAIEARARFLGVASEIDPAISDRYLDLDHNLKIENLIEFYRSFKTRVKVMDLEPLAKSDFIIAEGAQGVLIDQDLKEAYPHVTWSDTTGRAARRLYESISSSSFMEYHHIGVTRPYMVRHGPGPLPTEDEELSYPEPHNETNQWQRNVRYGHLDLVALRRASRMVANPPLTSIAVTCLDHLQTATKVRTSSTLRRGMAFVSVESPKEYRSFDESELIESIEQTCSRSGRIRTSIVSYGPDRSDKKMTGERI